VSKRINAVKRHAFRPYADAVDQLLQGFKTELHICVAGMMIFAILASAFGFVIAGTCPGQDWIVFHASPFARMVAPIKPQPVLARLADQGLFLLQ
jgi:hypothetical protein